MTLMVLLLKLFSQDLCINSESPSTPLSFPLCDASDVLKRLGLPPPKDLDSLLQDASKPSQNSKNNLDQQRFAKQLPPRSGLPHFPWSQSFNGSSRTNSEAAKLVTGKTLCQGRWLRIPDTTMGSPEGITDNFANLESLTFNQNLVPPLQKQTIAGTKTSQTIFANITSCQCQCPEASVSTLQKASFVPKGRICYRFFLSFCSLSILLTKTIEYQFISHQMQNQRDPVMFKMMVCFHKCYY